MPRDAVSFTTVLLLCAAAALVGGRFGDTLGRPGRVVSSDALAQEGRRFRVALDTIEQRLADPIDAEGAVYQGAIPGMLALLDPHSQFFDPERFERLREEQRGDYAGVGMQIRIFRGEPIVDFPFPDSPAFHAGVRPGDVIRSINGAPTSGLSVTDVAQTVRGKPGTTVRLALARNGGMGLVEVDLERGAIARPTIPIAFELRPGVGYLRITTFGQTTARELEKVLADFHSRGLEGLVLDLRDNSGGLLQAGVDVAGSFLAPGAAIVSHRGRTERRRRYRSRSRKPSLPCPRSRRRYRAPSGGSRTSYPMTVLVNCRSASASEIVAGALQDHDRALILGANTFGKGLVQSVYNLADGTGLTLTTARYYTPSGRQIQRGWEGVSRDAYYGDPCDVGYEPRHEQLSRTTAGRAVYSGGGIAPDVYLPEPELSEVQQTWLNDRVFARFADTMDLRRIKKSWRPDADTLERFREFLLRESPETAGRFDDNRAFIQRYLANRTLTAAFTVDDGARAETEADPLVISAAAHLGEAARLLDKRQGAIARAD